MHIDETRGWFGGTVLDLAAKDDVVLAATLAGIHRSTDGGRSWQRVGGSLPDQFVQAVALTSDNESDLAVAASNAGWLYLSHDQGANWETAESWHNVGSLTRVAISPDVSTDGIVLACTGENGIYKSTDRGRTWKAANFGLLNLSVLSLSFTPTFDRDEVILAGTDGGGLFRSRNAARAWRESGAGLPDATVQSIAFSPNFGEDGVAGNGVIFAGTDGYGLYRSTDKARTWSPVSDTLAHASINTIILTDDWATGGLMLLATDDGIWLSSDAGATWKLIDADVEDAYILARTGDTYLAGTYEGVYRSHAGLTWRTSNAGLAAHLPPLVHFSDAFERDQTLVMAAMDGELARSEDGGHTWTALSTGADEEGIAALAGAGTGKTMTLFAATDSGLMRSQDSGDHWIPVLRLESPVTALTVSSRFAQDNALLLGTADGRVLVSQDGGTSWQRANSFNAKTVVTLGTTGHGTTSYAVTAQQMDAATWQLTLREVASGKAQAVRQAEQPTAVLYAAPNSDSLFCALGSYVVDLHNDVIVVESELPDATPVACFAGDSDRLFAGTRSGLYISNDNGQSWEIVTSGEPIVALHQTDAGQVYAVKMGGKLHEIDIGNL